MRTLGVVIGDPPAKASPQLGTGLEGMEVDALVLQGAPESLDEDIVHPPAPAIHADADLSVAQHAGEGLRRKLAALIRVEDFWLAEPGQRLLQRALPGQQVSVQRFGPALLQDGNVVSGIDDVEVDTNKSMEIYREWLKMARPAPGPGGGCAALRSVRLLRCVW